MVSLSPELTHAPTLADEPSRRAGGAATRTSQPVSPTAGGRTHRRAGRSAIAAGRRRRRPCLRRGQPRARAPRASSRPRWMRPASVPAPMAATFAVVRDGQVRVGRQQRRRARRAQPADARQHDGHRQRHEDLRGGHDPRARRRGAPRASTTPCGDSCPRCARSAARSRSASSSTTPAASPTSSTTRRDAAWRSTRSAPGPTRQVLGDTPCAVVPAGRGLGVCEYQLLPAGHGRRARHRIDTSSEEIQRRFLDRLGLTATRISHRR